MLDPSATESFTDHLLSFARVGAAFGVPFPIAVLTNSALFELPTNPSIGVLIPVQVVALVLLVFALRFPNGSGITAIRALGGISLMFAVYVGLGALRTVAAV